ncbi:MAG: PAS domain-containing protein [Acidobacteria bacterium]|nr:PAS domain-containing protein [Acidobacteriota bacterium]
MGNDRVSLPRQLPRALRKLEAAVAAVLLVGGVLMLADLATSSLETTLREHVLLFSAFVLTTLGTAGVIWLLQDERRRVKDAVEEMRVRESIEATLLESVPNPVFSKNGDGVYITCNDAFLEFVGRKRDEVIGKGVHEIFPPDRARLYERADAELFARGGSQRYEHSTTDARGVLRHFHIHKAVFRGATPSEGGIVGVLNDVTELVEERSRLQTTQRALEASLASKGELLAQLERARSRAEAASRAKSAFLANMSHEIRTPLHAILGMSEALADAGLPPAHLEAVEMIRTSGRALDSVIRDILDFSRIEAGKLAVIHEPMRVWQVVEEALDIVAPLAASKRLTLVPDIARDVPEWVASDPGRLRQILVNLLGNAVKFTERGEVVVHVRLQRARGSKSAATHDTALGRASIFFCVRDTGIGIPASRVDAMLEPFQQGDSSTTRRHEGTGLGLAISASLAKLLGGSLRIRSREGRGTSVIVTIEAQRLPRPVEAATTPFLEAEQPELRGKRALCVIEVPTQARAVRRMLTPGACAWRCSRVPRISRRISTEAMSPMCSSSRARRSARRPALLWASV